MIAPGDILLDKNYGRRCAVIAVRPKSVLVAVVYTWKDESGRKTFCKQIRWRPISDLRKHSSFKPEAMAIILSAFREHMVCVPGNKAARRLQEHVEWKDIELRGKPIMEEVERWIPDETAGGRAWSCRGNPFRAIKCGFVAQRRPVYKGTAHMIKWGVMKLTDAMHPLTLHNFRRWVRDQDERRARVALERKIDGNEAALLRILNKVESASEKRSREDWERRTDPAEVFGTKEDG